MHDSMDDALHERLCAWLMGELSPDEAREMEARVAGSQSLAAERDRIEATLNLVRDAFEQEPTLSDAAMARVMSAAGASTAAGNGRLAWFHRPAWRAAAAVLALVGGVIGILSLEEGSGTSGVDLRLARVEESSSEMHLEEKLERAPGELHHLGEVADRDEVPGGAASRGRASESKRLGLGYTEGEQLDLTEQGHLELGYSGAPGEEIAQDETSGEAARKELTDRVALQMEKSQPSEVHVVAGIEDANKVPVKKSAGEGDLFLVENEVEDRGVAALDSLDGETIGAGGGGGRTDWDMERISGGAKGEVPSEQSEAGALLAIAPTTPKPASKGGGRYVGPGDSAPPTEPADGYVPSPGQVSPYAEMEPPAVERKRRQGRESWSAPANGLLDRESPRKYFGRPSGRPNPDEILAGCLPRPHETARDMYFRFYGDNPFVSTAQDNASTFSVDVDTASYALTRNYLRRGMLPPRAAVRTEEFINYFKPDLAPPSEGTFALYTDLAPSRFGGAPGRLMLRVGLRGRVVDKSERRPMALTFVVDVSGSMEEGGRLELVKHALRLLLTQLDARDRIGLVAFSNEARLILPMTPVTQRALIETALHPLHPDGGTNAEAGLMLGYELARSAVDPGIISRVIFLSDGVANIGQTDQDVLSARVREQREQGIYLNTIGVGMNNHNDVFLERLADLGDGICDYVDDAQSAKRALVDRFSGALVPIASDVKLQVLFDPTRVARYRLLGYENRAIADVSFTNSAIDAGEIGSGHQVVALYELDPVGGEWPDAAEPLSIGTVKLRWKEPKRTGQDPREIRIYHTETQVSCKGMFASFDESPAGFRRSALVAQFAEFLRHSTHARGDSFAELIREAEALAPVLSDADFDEFIELLHRAEPLLQVQWRRLAQDELQRTIEEYQRLIYNQTLLTELQRNAHDRELLEDLRAQNAQYEQRIRDLLEHR